MVQAGGCCSINMSMQHTHCSILGVRTSQWKRHCPVKLTTSNGAL